MSNTSINVISNFQKLMLIDSEEFKNYTVTCAYCGEVIESLEDCKEGPGGNIVCLDCREEVVFCCDRCGKWFYREDVSYVDSSDEYVCDDCLDNHYFRCDDCGEFYRNSHSNNMASYTGNRVEVCDDCVEDGDYIYYCENCGETFYDRHDDGWSERDKCFYCPDCIDDHRNNSVIGDYHDSHDRCRYFNPPFKYDNVYLGFELEVDSDSYISDREECASDIKDILGDYINIEDDGSLNYGFELITEPWTLEKHMEIMPKWEKAISRIKESDLKSHDVGTCGLHVHVSSNAIEARDPAIIGKIMWAMDRFWDKFVAFSRRNESQLNRWAKRYCVNTTPEDMEEVRQIKEQGRMLFDRYMALNLRNRATIEFRLFRGTLKLSTIIATLQFVQTIIDNLSTMSYADMQTMTWNDLVKSDYTELNEYLESKGL